MKRLCIALVLASVLFTTGLADEQAPVMSETNRLKIQLYLRDLEISQLRAQAAQRDFETSKAGLTALIASLDVPGYTLNVQTQSYDKKVEQK